MIEQIRQYLIQTWQLIDPDDDCRLIDNAPVPVCTYARASRNRTINGAEYFSVMKSRGTQLFGLLASRLCSRIETAFSVLVTVFNIAPLVRGLSLG